MFNLQITCEDVSSIGPKMYWKNMSLILTQIKWVNFHNNSYYCLDFIGSSSYYSQDKTATTELMQSFNVCMLLSY